MAGFIQLKNDYTSNTALFTLKADYKTTKQRTSVHNKRKPYPSISTTHGHSTRLSHSHAYYYPHTHIIACVSHSAIQDFRIDGVSIDFVLSLACDM